MNPHKKNKIDINVSPLYPTRLLSTWPALWPISSFTPSIFRPLNPHNTHSSLPCRSPPCRLSFFSPPLCIQVTDPKKKTRQTLSPEEQRLFRLYGKLPSRSDHFAKHLKERKYFDSGDYAMSKAGKGDSVDAGAVGSQHPLPENIPHLSSPAPPAPGARP